MKIRMFLSILAACALLAALTACGHAAAEDKVTGVTTAATVASTSGEVTTVTETNTITTYPGPGPLTPLTDAQIQQLKTDYFKFRQVSGKLSNEFTEQDVLMKGYLGTYHGAEAVFISLDEYFLQDFEDESVAGYDFNYGSSQRIYIHINSSFIQMSQAYVQGILTQEDVWDILYYYTH